MLAGLVFAQQNRFFHETFGQHAHGELGHGIADHYNTVNGYDESPPATYTGNENSLFNWGNYNSHPGESPGNGYYLRPYAGFWLMVADIDASGYENIKLQFLLHNTNDIYDFSVQVRDGNAPLVNADPLHNDNWRTIQDVYAEHGNWGSGWKWIEIQPSGSEAIPSTSNLWIKFNMPTGSINALDDIDLYGDEKDDDVPVELSSFTATVSAQNFITLTWVTQTETGMRGYYVFRAPANDLASAQIVSPMIESMNSSQQQIYIYEDTELYDSGIYYYWLQANDLDGSSSFHGPVSVVYSTTGDQHTPEIPLVTQLHSVYPNPFNPTVFIPFSLAEDGAVSFKIYNSRGQMVKHFDLGAKSAGHHRITWDGTDYDGKALANGVYQIMMSTKNQVYQSKATLLK